MSDSPTDIEVARADTKQSPADDRGQDQTRAPNDSESDSGHKDAEKDKAKEAERNRRRPVVIAVGILVVVLLAAGGLYYWLSTRNLESTDDAYTDGHAIAIAPQVSGIVVSLDVTDPTAARAAVAAALSVSTDVDGLVDFSETPMAKMLVAHGG